ncbi:MAG: hypothetical protein H8D22_05335 [Candidatus Cloacimonetes bacterium]|nr:hypothetical protein [Candidatus Cloacimonadota bacterium]
MQDKKHILNMVQEGKISAKEALNLIDALNEKKDTEVKSRTRKLKIQVWEDESEKPKVNISIPLAIVKIGTKFIPQNVPINANIGSSKFDFSSIDWNEIFELASKGEVGDIFSVDSEEDDGSITKVRIFIE